MTDLIDREPETDEELVDRLRALYDAAVHSAGARDDFWDCVSTHAGWIIDLTERAIRNKRKKGSGSIGGKKRAENLSPERRREIAKLGSQARIAKLASQARGSRPS
jgi:hypothetical protein